MLYMFIDRRSDVFGFRLAISVASNLSFCRSRAVLTNISNSFSTYFKNDEGRMCSASRFGGSELFSYSS
jgi:hypothetical protein